jgi:hypothetical protein
MKLMLVFVSVMIVACTSSEPKLEIGRVIVHEQVGVVVLEPVEIVGYVKQAPRLEIGEVIVH